MSSTNTHPDTGQWLTINEIANRYGTSASSVRSKLNAALEARFGDVPKTKVDLIYRPGSGRVGHHYHIDFVKGIFDSGLYQPFTEAQREVFNKPRLPSTKVCGPNADSLLMGILESRMKANEAYNAFLTEMITFGQGLRIRCITGTDFFNTHHPTADAFSKRAKNGLDPARILLIYPLGHGADVRCAAEGESDPKKSQLHRDAASTFSFIDTYWDEFKLDVKWVEDMPPSLLVWTENYSLIELYDYGCLPKDRFGCIGRHAPVMVVNAGATYHTILRNSFDYVFEGQAEKTRIKMFSREDVRGSIPV